MKRSPHTTNSRGNGRCIVKPHAMLKIQKRMNSTRVAPRTGFKKRKRN